MKMGMRMRMAKKRKVVVGGGMKTESEPDLKAYGKMGACHKNNSAHKFCTNIYKVCKKA